MGEVSPKRCLQVRISWRHRISDGYLYGGDTLGEENFKNRGELVFETLKREILDLRLKPGQMISENDICDRFGVSRTCLLYTSDAADE